MIRIKAKEFPTELAKSAEMEEPMEVFGGEEIVEEDTPIPSDESNKKKTTTMKVLVWACLLNGLAWVWCSYILAWMGREQIAESLSQVALTEIIGVVLVYAIKAAVENLSKNNSWPDKHSSDPPDGVG